MFRTSSSRVVAAAALPRPAETGSDPAHDPVCREADSGGNSPARNAARGVLVLELATASPSSSLLASDAPDSPNSSPDLPHGTLVTEVVGQLDDTIRCRRCRHDVTAGRYAIEVDGAHAHTFRNPAGWSFRLGCFADAPGAAVSGAATYTDTWFSGYAWRFAHCTGCGTHLGWWFVGGTTAFAGLVVARLM